MAAVTDNVMAVTTVSSLAATHPTVCVLPLCRNCDGASSSPSIHNFPVPWIFAQVPYWPIRFTRAQPEESTERQQDRRNKEAHRLALRPP